MKKIIVITGPTSSGKTDIAIEVAKRIQSEIVSADSRQLYIGLDELSGKVRQQDTGSIKHHMLDVADPKNIYTVSDYERDALKCVEEIHNKGRIPILCGGSGFYINSIIYKNTFQNIPPNPNLREKLEKENIEKLSRNVSELVKNAKERVDLKNKRRMIRAIEIIKNIGHFPKRKLEKRFDVVYVLLNPSQEYLERKIEKRLNDRWRKMIEETKGLMKNGLSRERLNDLGLEPRYISKLITGELNEKECKAKLLSEIKKYSKRQRVWFKQYKDAKSFNESQYGEIPDYCGSTRT